MTRIVASVLGVTIDVLNSLPPRTLIVARGVVTSVGWTGGELRPRVYAGGTPSGGIQDFDFVAKPPDDDFASGMLSPLSASFVWDEVPENIQGIRVHASRNYVETCLVAAAIHRF